MKSVILPVIIIASNMADYMDCFASFAGFEFFLFLLYITHATLNFNFFLLNLLDLRYFMIANNLASIEHFEFYHVLV